MSSEASPDGEPSERAGSVLTADEQEAAPGADPGTTAPGDRAVRGGAHRRRRPGSVVPGDDAETRASLQPIRIAAVVAFAVQLAILCWWSHTLFTRFAVGFDFVQYHQAWYQIAHGNLNPVDSAQGWHFWQNHGELLLWPLSLAYWIWPEGVTLLWLQDLATVGAGVVAFMWMCDVIADRRRPALESRLLAGAGLVLLVANPWIYWSNSWDFHMEVFAALFLLLAGATSTTATTGRSCGWRAPCCAGTSPART